MKKQLLILAMLLLAGSIFAQQVSMDEARQRATSFLQSQRVKKVQAQNGQTVSAPNVELAYVSKRKADQKVCFYVFNQANDGGFVIVGGDESAKDILGYSYNGNFDYDNAPENLKWWLSQYEDQISVAIKQVEEGKASADDLVRAKRAPRKAKAAINYLVQTQWDQVAPFNCMHPFNITNNIIKDNEVAMATGCVATAGAQIMKFHEWPTTGVGSHTDINRITGHDPFSANFGETTYRWDKMRNNYDYCAYNGSEADIAVGTLMYHVGVAVDMQFGQLGYGGSSASARKLSEALVNHFKYSKGITYHERTYYSDEQWEDMVYDELAAGRPVLYGGQQKSGSGHAFVCDGYENGLYHINWGWSGYCDGLFLLTPTPGSGSVLNPEGSGSGGGEAGEGYYMSQHIGIGITPDYDGTSLPAKSAFTQGITLATSTTTPGGEIQIDGYYCGNGSVVPQAYNLKLKYTNTDDESDVIIGSYIRTTNEISPGSAVGSNEPFIAPYTLEPDQSYYVTMMYENSDGEYVDMPQPQNWEPQVLEVTEPTGIALSKELTIDNNGYMSEKHGKVNFSLKNFDSEQKTIKQLIVWIFGEDGGSRSYWLLQNESFEAGEEKNYSLGYSQLGTGGNLLAAGNDYVIRVHDYQKKVYLSPQVPLHLRADKPINFTLTSAGWGTLCLPYNAEVPEGLTAYTVTGTDGYNLVKEEVSTFEMNKPYLITGTPDTYTFEGPETPELENLKNGFLVGNTTAAQTYAPQASYVLQNLTAKDGLAFYKVENNGTQKVRQYGAYLTAGSYLTSFFKFIDDGATVITGKPYNRTNDNATYNLNGVRVNGNTRGIVIRNGKLFINK